MDPLLFYGFNYDELPNIKCWMVVLSYHWLLYSIYSGGGVFPCLQYEDPLFKLYRKANRNGDICNLCSHCKNITWGIGFYYYKKYAILSSLLIP